MDSEYALSVFLHMGMEVTPVIVKLNPNYNDHDIKYAFKFCELKNIKPLIIDIDVPQFVNSGRYYDIMKITEGSLPGAATTIYSMGLLDGSVLSGTGEPYIGKHPTTGEWYFILRKFEWMMDNYFDKMGIDGTGFFNAYSTKMLSAWLADPRIVKLGNNLIPGKLDSISSKHYVYNNHNNFNLEVRPKFNGYEKIFETWLTDPIFNHEEIQRCQAEVIDVNKGMWAVKYSELTKHLGIDND
jgi:hypothetical protein